MIALLDPPWVTKARAEIGVAEIAGPAANPRIVEYDSVTSLKATSDEVAWCSSFTCWCMEKSGIVSPRSARALDWLHWGTEIRVPILGAIAVFDFGGHGHVGSVVGRGAPGFLAILGGNQSNQVKISMMSTARLTSMRWPSLPVLDLAAPPIALAETR